MFPLHLMVTRIHGVPGHYRAAGGRAVREMFERSGRGPQFDVAQAWSEALLEFLASVE